MRTPGLLSMICVFWSRIRRRSANGDGLRLKSAVKFQSHEKKNEATQRYICFLNVTR